MDLATLQSILTIGETVAVEFKRCSNGIESDTYETVCSFLNRFGGDIFMGVLDDGSILGVPEKAASDMVKNFIKVVSNPTLFSPTVYLVPEIIKYDEKHTIIHVHVPPSAEVHSYKKIIYDRVDDAEMLKSAGLYGRNIATGEEGYNLAAIMLLGKDDVIINVAPAYVTDALVRKVNVDRYDDREVIKTNLIESYDMLMDFGKKHLPDKFFLEGDVNKSLRNTILREMVSNVLMHREFTNSYTAKFVIEKERMYVENANRAASNGCITEDNLEPIPKNPVIASFFRNIGYADQLGSGVRNLFKYSKYYSGQLPEFIEGDIFRIIVPLDEKYSFDFGQNGQTNQSNQSNQTQISEDEILLLNLIKEYPDMTNSLLAEKLGWSVSRVKYYIQKLKQFGKIRRKGTNRNGRWEVL